MPTQDLYWLNMWLYAGKYLKIKELLRIDRPGELIVKLTKFKQKIKQKWCMQNVLPWLWQTTQFKDSRDP